MKNKKHLLFIISVLAGIFLNYCKSLTSPEEDPLIYYNSFEQNSDLEQWTKCWEMSLVEDPAPSCGKRSVRMIRANSSYRFEPKSVDQIIQIEFYGKKIGGRAEVVLCVGEYSANEYHIPIIDKSWTIYQNQGNFFWPADSSLTICFKNEGLIPSVMCLDELKIQRLK